MLWLSLAQLITWGSVFYTFALLLEPVERELGLSRAQSSLAFSLALLAEGVFAYPVGRWIDRGHERAVMTGGSLLAWPPRKVIVMIARRKSCGKRRVTTANTGVYSVPASAAPSSVQVA